MMPSCDQTGLPHFHSSTTSGSASLMSWRILLRVSPRQSPSSAILFEMSSDADWPWRAPDFFMFSCSPAAGTMRRLNSLEWLAAVACSVWFGLLVGSATSRSTLREPPDDLLRVLPAVKDATRSCSASNDARDCSER